MQCRAAEGLTTCLSAGDGRALGGGGVCPHCVFNVQWGTQLMQGEVRRVCRAIKDLKG